MYKSFNLFTNSFFYLGEGGVIYISEIDLESVHVLLSHQRQNITLHIVGSLKTAINSNT